MVAAHDTGDAVERELDGRRVGNRGHALHSVKVRVASQLIPTGRWVLAGSVPVNTHPVASTGRTHLLERVAVDRFETFIRPIVAAQQSTRRHDLLIVRWPYAEAAEPTPRPTTSPPWSWYRARRSCPRRNARGTLPGGVDTELLPPGVRARLGARRRRRILQGSDHRPRDQRRLPRRRSVLGGARRCVERQARDRRGVGRVPAPARRAGGTAVRVGDATRNAGTASPGVAADAGVGRVETRQEWVTREPDRRLVVRCGLLQRGGVGPRCDVILVYISGRR